MKNYRFAIIVLAFIAVSLGLFYIYNYNKVVQVDNLTGYPLFDAEAPPWQLGMDAYFRGEFEAAIPYLTPYTEQAQPLYYLGLCYLELGEDERAALLLEKVRYGGTVYYAESSWYLALAYLKLDRTSEAADILFELENGPDAFYAAKARQFSANFLEAG